MTTPPPGVTYKGQTYVLAPKPRRPRAADSMTTSIKFSAAEFERLAEVAHRSGLTRHAIMKLAILYYLDGIDAETLVAIGVRQPAGEANTGTDAESGAGTSAERTDTEGDAQAPRRI
jgi:hypothetical protein